jgi:hypothetical protein
MAELVKQSLAHVQKVETRAAVKHIAPFTIVAATAILVIFGAVLCVQGQSDDKYSPIWPGRYRVLRLQGI